MNKLLTTILCTAGIALPLAAVNVVRPAKAPTPERTRALEATQTTEAAPVRAQQPQLIAVSKAPMRANTSFEDYGTFSLLLEEDFHLCSSGSLTNPNIKTEIGWPRPEEDDPDYSPWRNIKEGYTTLPGWGVGNAYQAGGCIFLFASDKRGQAHINTPVLDCSQTDGICVLEFKARAEEDTNRGLLLECAETRNMGPTWDILDPQMVGEIGSDQWYTVRALFQGGGPTTLFNICQALPQGCFIDDVKVYDVNMFLKCPELLPYTDYTDDSFMAHWKPVQGAEKYLISVYTVHDEFDQQMNKTSTRRWVYQDLETTATDFKVDTSGENHAENYFVMVKAIGGGHESLYSLPQNVWNITAPKDLISKEVTDGCHYHASWTPSADAERYNYYAYRQRTAEADGPFTIADENFEHLYYPGTDDVETEVTPETDADPNYGNEVGGFSDYFLEGSTAQKGWHAAFGYPGAGMVRVDGYQYIFNGKQAGLMSPEMDLSKDGGKAHLSIDLYGVQVPESAGYTDVETGLPVSPTVQAGVAVFTWDPTIGDYKQVYFARTGLKGQEAVEPAWKTFEFDVEGCTDRTIIGIFALDVGDYLYLDNLKLTQNYKKGDTFMDPGYCLHWYDRTWAHVALPSTFDYLPIYHRVQAVRSRIEGEGQLANSKFLESDFTPLTYVLTASGVNEVVLSGTQVRVNVSASGLLTVTGAETATVFDANGARLADGLNYQLPAHGIYMVRTGENTIKVIF